jgi:Kef-type K+ transport system membrane component KefB/voltage-gated potassium channel Kch
MHKLRFFSRLVPLAPAVLALTAPANAAGGELPPLVHDVGMALFLSGLLAVIFARIRFPAIAGYILGGLVAGPLFLGLVTDAANIETIADLGFVLLLFVIGLEMNIRKIAQSGRPIIITGLLEYPAMVLVGFLVAKLLALVGFAAIVNGNLPALYIGMVVACSSTLIVVKLFQETFELDTVPGRVALGMLVIEDVWAIVVIVLQPSFDQPDVLAIMASFAGIALLGGVAYAFSRTLFPVAFRWIAKLPEVILIGATGWCFAIVFLGSSFDWITEQAFGWHTHLSVGPGMAALIAGVTIATLPYATEIITKVSVVKDFFVTLFFVGLGLSIPPPSGAGVLALALCIAALAIALRQLIVFPLLYFSGLDRRNAEVTAVRLAQISEFSLVIAFLGVDLGHLSRDLQSAIIFAFVLAAVLTTPLYHSAYRIQAALAPIMRRLGFKDPPEAEKAREKEWRLALLGFHRVASSLLHDLARTDRPLVADTLVVDFNVALHDRIRSLGAHVEYGDLSNPDTLHHAGIEHARIVISTVPDDLMRGIDNRRLVASVRRLSPNAIIIANAVNLADCDDIYAAGADYVFLSRIETARALTEVIGEALNGTLARFRAMREEQGGKPGARDEVLR